MKECLHIICMALVDSVTPKPAWQLTSVSSLHLRSLFSGNDKILLDLPPDMKATEKYVHVMTIDAELRKWISASLSPETRNEDCQQLNLLLFVLDT